MKHVHSGNAAGRMRPLRPPRGPERTRSRGVLAQFAGNAKPEKNAGRKILPTFPNGRENFADPSAKAVAPHGRGPHSAPPGTQTFKEECYGIDDL
jgi:hypothetical protein